MRLDGGAVFGTVPREEWGPMATPDSRNRILLGSQALLLTDQEAGRVVLVDAGLGDKFSTGDRERLALDERPAPSLLDSLKTRGLSRHDITDVVITHLHFDHAGGLTYDDSGGRLAPTFPSARHWIQARHLDWARSEVGNIRGAFPRENIDPLWQSGLFALTRGEEELFRGLRVLPLNGHTKAMQAVLVEGEPPLLFASDLFPIRGPANNPG